MADMIVARNRIWDYYPPGWFRWSSEVEAGAEPTDLALSCYQAELNRFAARYRVANAFAGVRLEGFSEETADGYAGLFRVFLAWTAFEQYLKIHRCKQKDCGVWTARHFATDMVPRIRALDENDRFFLMLRSRVNAEVAAELRKYLSGREFNVTYLASAVRHIFAHGYLTPNANRAKPEAVAAICQLLAKNVLRASGRDFGQRVKEYMLRRYEA